MLSFKDLSRHLEKLASKGRWILFAWAMNRRSFLRAGAGSALLLTDAVLGRELGRTNPTKEQILSRIKTSHPRLLVSEVEFERLKAQVGSDAKLQTWHKKLQEQAVKILAAPPSRYEIPDGLRLLDTSRRVLDRIYNLSLLYRLEKDSRFVDRAWDELKAAANFPDWNPRHFLDTAEMTHAFAIAYDWLYEAWTPEQRNELRNAMVDKGLKPALKVYHSASGWHRVRHNWNQVCNGGIGVGALALANVEAEIAGEILENVLESLPLAMAEYAPDGAWKEGPGYWNYATSYSVILLAALQSALGSDFGLSQMKGFDETGFFPLYLTGPLGRTFNYADGGDRTIRAPQMFWLAQRFKQPVFAWYERQVGSPNPLDLLWFDPAGAGPKSAGLLLDRYFRGAEVAIFRSEWEDPKALFVGFKAGDNKANHSHLDLGDFVFDALGVRWAADLGSDDYNLPGYFGAQRWQYYRLRAEGQNTLVLNPDSGPDQDPKAEARIIRFDSKPNRTFAIADLTSAYAKHARRVWRGLSLLDRTKFLVQDEIDANPPVDLWWFMHTPAAAKIEDNGRSAILQQGGAQLGVELLSPAEGKFQIMNAEPLPSSPQPANQAKNQTFKKLAIHLGPFTSNSIMVLLKPVAEQGRATEAPLSLTPLSEW
jgi:hypothetical protein